MSLPQIPIGNAFPVVVELSIQDNGVTTPVSDLASADDIVCYIGRDVSNPELSFDLNSGRISINDPSTGSITISIISTDTVSIPIGEYLIAVQVKYNANNENNVEWVEVPVFKLRKNNIPPTS